MSLRSSSLSIKVLFLASVIGLAVIFILPNDEFGIKCGSKSFIPFAVVILMVLVPLITAIAEIIKRKISAVAFIVIFIILMLMASVTGLPLLRGIRSYPSWKGTLANMRQLQLAQEIFYKKNNRYADTQEELIAFDILAEKLKNRITNKELTDKDGKGIEGSDNDPKTWLATVHMRYKEFNMWCIPIEEEYQYTCDQDGCRKEKTEIELLKK